MKKQKCDTFVANGEEYPYCKSFTMVESVGYLAIGNDIFFLRPDDHDDTLYNTGVANIKIICNKNNDLSRLHADINDIKEIEVVSHSYPYKFTLYPEQIMFVLKTQED